MSREFNGLLVINKPKGITSFDVIRQLRRITGERKIGHTGTLDPMATGVMILLFGSATKRAGEYSQLDKTYLAEITLGFTSSTGDAEGELREISDTRPDRGQVESVLTAFIGTIKQTPPVYSAIKIGGQEAYKRARRGEEVEMPTRQVTIHSIKLIEYDYPKLTIQADVSSGTYIRTLAADIGQKLGTGAYLSALERTKAGDFNLDQAISLDSSQEIIESNITAV
ncbi:MAG TPA: tRNA pseudouridine(55) synthase TruB [Candidatus Saccharimonadales bacterium]|nr:tRNA pseudouridine(55) synthase TruB [Candidatus Saccharimonadales bacterium]